MAETDGNTGSGPWQQKQARCLRKGGKGAEPAVEEGRDDGEFSQTNDTLIM